MIGQKAAAHTSLGAGGPNDPVGDHSRRPFEIAGRADRRSENVPLLVQKYGGSSLANPEKILRAARRAIAAHRQGSHVVVVVSAVGDTTDDLIAMARQISERPSARELDQLLAPASR